MKNRIIILMIFVSTVCAAQETLSHQNYFRLSYEPMFSVPTSLLNPESPNKLEDISFMTHSLGVEWSHQINTCLDVGVYVGLKNASTLHITKNQMHISSSGDSTFGESEWFSSYMSVRYGISSRIHLLPLASVDNNHWDIYMVGELGGWISNSIRTEGGIGAGIGYFPTKHLGLFAENIFGKFYSTSSGHLLKNDVLLRFGIVFRK
ncbi:MAG: hypothetical protein K5918_04545 [Bacteroidales bacterium]|nr:hypothetical protein [Bacteroidales bacterium]